MLTFYSQYSTFTDDGFLLTRARRLAKDTKKYAEFWDQYAANVKYGMLEDNDNKIRLSKLLRFHSSNGPEWMSLDDYVGRMKKGQEDIYYLAGESRESVEKSPIVERLIKRGYEVIFCEDPLDEVRLAFGTVRRLTHSSSTP